MEDKKELSSQELAAAEAEETKKAEAEALAKEQEKAKKEGKQLYKCIYGVRHNGTLHKDKVSLTKEEAAPLLKAGAISK